MKADNDTQQMLRFRAGDEQAFRTLYIRYRKKIVNYCYRFFSDRRVAEELAQEVFVKVYRAAPRYKPKARFSTWIFKIATNLCLNELRKKQYHCSVESLDEPYETPEGQVEKEVGGANEQQPQAMYEAAERDKLIHNALAKLPGKQRAALILRIYQGFTYSEIAVQLKGSESSVKSLIHRGRESLKHDLKDYIKGL